MKKIEGFTLIEVMIVIAVFSIGVLATLKLVLFNLDFVYNISSKNTATFLSKEAISMVYNIRDSNRLASLPRDCIANSGYSLSNLTDTSDIVCVDYLLSGKQNNVWNIGFDFNQKMHIEPIDYKKTLLSGFDLNRIYAFESLGSSGLWYTYDKKGIPTEFYRYVLLTGVVENGKILPQNLISKIESHVIYKRGTKTGEVVLESFIGNY